MPEPLSAADGAGTGTPAGTAPAPDVTPEATPEAVTTATGPEPPASGPPDADATDAPDATAASGDSTTTAAPDGISAGRLLALSVAAAAWTVILLSVAATKTDGLSRIAAAAGGLIGVAVAVLGLFPPLRPPSIPRRSAVWAVIAVLCADGLVTVGWPVWSYYRANRTVTVSDWTLTHNQRLLPEHAATFHTGIGSHRKYVVITFEATDTDREIGSCAALTTLSVVPASTARPQQAVQAALDERVKVRLPQGQREITLTVTVVNTRGDANCAVDLQVSRVALTNG